MHNWIEELNTEIVDCHDELKKVVVEKYRGMLLPSSGGMQHVFDSATLLLGPSVRQPYLSEKYKLTKD